MSSTGNKPAAPVANLKTAKSTDDEPSLLRLILFILFPTTFAVISFLIAVVISACALYLKFVIAPEFDMVLVFVIVSGTWSPYLALSGVEEPKSARAPKKASSAATRQRPVVVRGKKAASDTTASSTATSATDGTTSNSTSGADAPTSYTKNKDV